MKKISILTFGCQMNRADSERMLGEMQIDGFELTENLDEANLILANTCCVRESAEEKIFGKLGELKHLKTKNPNLILGVTGCMAQKDGSKILEKAIENEVNLLNGRYDRIIIGGHSQGACISLYQAYNSDKNIGGVISFSGILPPGDISPTKDKIETYFKNNDKPVIIVNDSSNLL